MSSIFKKAQKHQSKLRLALIGVAGSGKTYSALAMASGLGKKIAVLDTEHGSAQLYADKFNFDVVTMTESHAVSEYIYCIEEAQKEGYDVLVIDSLTHAWSGKDGSLERVEAAKTRSNGNSWAAWRDVTPAHNRLVDAILGSNMHIIATMRAKTEYVSEKDEKGKTTIKKVGLAPIQRDGMEYEFTMVGDIDLEHNFVVTKTRCDLFDGKIINKPGRKMAEQLLSWLNDGVKDAPVSKVPQPVVDEEEEQQAAASTEDDLTEEFKRLAMSIDAAETADELAPLLPLIKEHKDVNMEEAVALNKRYKEQKALLKAAAGS